MHKLVFFVNDFEHPHIGYTNGDDWNGWATPYFEIDEAIAIMTEYNADNPECPMTHNKTTDAFYIAETEYTSKCIWAGIDCLTAEGIKHLYGIGAYCWIWEFVNQANVKYIAERIEDFLWEFNTYEYRDQYDSREELAEAIINQLKDLNILKQMLITFYNFSLTEEELYNKLGKELKI